jgi:hypothetical protein
MKTFFDTHVSKAKSVIATVSGCHGREDLGAIQQSQEAWAFQVQACAVRFHPAAALVRPSTGTKILHVDRNWMI